MYRGTCVHRESAGVRACRVDSVISPADTRTTGSSRRSLSADQPEQGVTFLLDALGQTRSRDNRHPRVDLLPAHPSLETVAADLAQRGGLVTSIKRALRPVRAGYEFIVIDTHGDTGNLTLAALAAADSVLSVFTSDPGSAVGAARITSFLTMHRNFENTTATLLGVACSNWDGGFAAREVTDALARTGLPMLGTRIPFSRRVASSALAKQPVVLRAPGSPVAQAYTRLADEVLSIHQTARAA